MSNMRLSHMSHITSLIDVMRPCEEGSNQPLQETASKLPVPELIVANINYIKIQ
jgi:hypothetical protein